MVMLQSTQADGILLSGEKGSDVGEFNHKHHRWGIIDIGKLKKSSGAQSLPVYILYSRGLAMLNPGCSGCAIEHSSKSY
jgi:hypothetical protein